MAGCNAQQARLVGANLERANLERSWLRYADLRDARMKGANVAGADFWRATLAGTDVKEAVSLGDGAPRKVRTSPRSNLVGADHCGWDAALRESPGFDRQ